jgi:hypothetical protein
MDNVQFGENLALDKKCHTKTEVPGDESWLGLSARGSAEETRRAQSPKESNFLIKSIQSVLQDEGGPDGKHLDLHQMNISKYSFHSPKRERLGGDGDWWWHYPTLAGLWGEATGEWNGRPPEEEKTDGRAFFLTFLLAIIEANHTTHNHGHTATLAR